MSAVDQVLLEKLAREHGCYERDDVRVWTDRELTFPGMWDACDECVARATVTD